MRVLDRFTLCVPYYNQPLMLLAQLNEWESYPEAVRFIVVDDGSRVVPALPVVQKASESLRARIDLYRITEDIPWNRGGARNLAARECRTEWLVHVDTDHILPAKCAARLLTFKAHSRHWYRFERYRVGAADETRKKDRLPPDATFGQIHPHIDSYLVTQTLYWAAGGYNEGYSGCLGGGSPFLAELTKLSTPLMAPSEVHLRVYTRHAIADASVTMLSRDRQEYARRKSKMRTRPRPLQFSWTKELVT